MPTDRLWKYVAGLPRLRAQSGLDRVMQTAAGSGAMEEQDQKGFVRDLRSAAFPGQRRAEKASGAILAQIGIPVETIE